MHCIQSRLYIESSNANDWVSRDQVFKGWTKDADCHILQLCGSDGSGKTTLVRFLVKHLEKSSTVLSFFCTRLDDSRQSAKDILLSMVNQLLSYEPHLYNYVEGVLSGSENSLWTKEEIWAAFRILISRPRKQDLVCVIDDLDECNSAKWLVEQLVWLQEESDIPSKLVISTMRCFVNDTLCREKRAGRLVKLDLELDMDGIGEGNPSPPGMRDELVRCMEETTEAWIEGLCRKVRAYRGFKDLLGDFYRRCCRVSPLFLKLSFELLYPPETSVSAPSLQKQVGEILADISLEMVYEKLLQRVNEEDRSWARSVLQWICYASRPLTTTELSIALAIDFQHTIEKGRYSDTKGELSLDQCIPKDTRGDLAKVFGPLVEFDRDEIHLVHQSLHRFLVDPARSDLSVQGIEPQWYRFDSPELIHEHIFDVSLEYLTAGSMLQSFAESEALENDLELLSLVVPPDRKLQGFLRYASKYWPKHYRESKNLPRPLPGDHRVIDFLRGSTARSWYQIYQVLEGNKEGHPYDALSVIAKLGLPRIAHSFLYVTDTALSPARRNWGDLVALAAKHGHSTVVQQLLLECPPEVDLSKAFHKASAMGHDQVVHQLLSVAGVIGLTELNISAALCAAVCKGYEQVTRKLLEHQAPMMQPGGDDILNLLQYAAKHGQERIVRIILEHLESNTVNDDSGGSNEGVGEIHIATEEHSEVPSEEPLGGDGPGVYGEEESDKDSAFGSELEAENDEETDSDWERDLDPKVEDVSLIFTENGESVEEFSEGYLSPLHLAAAGGYLRTVRMLFGSGVSGLVNAVPSGTDPPTCTPLHLAVSGGYLKVAKFLSRLEDLSRTTRVTDQHGRYPIHLAARFGHKAIVEYLLKLDPNPAALGDSRGQQPIHLAAEFGHYSVVSVLLSQQPKMEKNALDKQGYSPLHLAARGGHSGIVSALIKEPAGAKIDRLGRHECTPLHLASKNGNISAMSILLDAGASVNKPVGKPSGSRYRQRPLHLACQHPEAIKLLLARPRIRKNIRDRDWSTPLILAARAGNADGVRYLNGKHAYQGAANNDGTTALHAAAECGNWLTVEQLLDVKRTQKIFAKSKAGMTPLELASRRSQSEICHRIIDWLSTEAPWSHPFKLAVNTSSVKAVSRWARYRPGDLTKNGDLTTSKGTPLIFLLAAGGNQSAIEKLRQSKPECLEEKDKKGRAITDIMMNESTRAFLRHLASLKPSSTTTDTEFASATEELSSGEEDSKEDQHGCNSCEDRKRLCWRTDCGAEIPEGKFFYRMFPPQENILVKTNERDLNTDCCTCKEFACRFDHIKRLCKREYHSLYACCIFDRLQSREDFAPWVKDGKWPRR